MQPTDGVTGAGEGTFKMASSQCRHIAARFCPEALIPESSQVDLSTGLIGCMNYDSSFFCVNMRQEELKCESTDLSGNIGREGVHLL